MFSALDLKSAYHQIPLHKDDKPYTAFEADGKLFQFCRLPFGLTNAVSAFQRSMNDLIQEYKLKDTFAYLDDILVCGRTPEEHDANLQRFKDVAHEVCLTLNNSKCLYKQTSIKYLGFLIENGTLRPDPDRLKLSKRVTNPN